MSRYVIIGGGIAGLAFACAMKKQGHEVVVCDRDVAHHNNGHGFLVHPEALGVLEKLALAGNVSGMKYSKITRMALSDNRNRFMSETPLNGWVCMRRSEPVRILSESLGTEHILYKRTFKGFIKDDNRYNAAVFDEDKIIEGDFFIGADGSHSLTRQILFGDTNYSPTMVREILGCIRDSSITKKYAGTFRKFLSYNSGLAFGLIPCNEKELIWFMQFDAEKYWGNMDNEESIRNFMEKTLSEFPSEVQEIIRSSLSVPGYIWNTTDFEPLPSYHKLNVALIGDAAHLALPFTSSGVANALLDAECLSELLEIHSDFSSALNAFYEKRSPMMKNHLIKGRQIRESFLKGSSQGFSLPLIEEVRA